VKIHDGFLGEIEITEAEIFDFEDGLLGFPGCRKFAIFALTDYPPFVGMQSLDDPAVGFVLVDPRFFVKEYKPDIAHTQLQKLDIQSAEEAQIYSIVVLDSDVKKITANLFGPILVNARKKIAGQCVLTNDQDKYLLKYPLYQTNTPKVG